MNLSSAMYLLSDLGNAVESPLVMEVTIVHISKNCLEDMSCHHYSTENSVWTIMSTPRMFAIIKSFSCGRKVPLREGEKKSKGEDERRKRDIQ